MFGPALLAMKDKDFKAQETTMVSHSLSLIPTLCICMQPSHWVEIDGQ